MDQLFLTYIAGDVYKRCFREVVSKDRPVGDQEEAELNNCIDKFKESYGIVGNAFVNFVKTQPTKTFKPDEE